MQLTGRQRILIKLKQNFNLGPWGITACGPQIKNLKYQNPPRWVRESHRWEAAASSVHCGYSLTHKATRAWTTKFWVDLNNQKSSCWYVMGKLLRMAILGPQGFPSPLGTFQMVCNMRCFWFSLGWVHMFIFPIMTICTSPWMESRHQ